MIWYNMSEDRSGSSLVIIVWWCILCEQVVNTQRISKNLYVNGKLMKLSKWWCKDCLKILVHNFHSYYILGIFNCTHYWFSAGIWRKLPICSVQNCTDWVIKNNWSGTSKCPRTVYIFSYYFMNLPNLFYVVASTLSHKNRATNCKILSHSKSR